MRDKAFLRWTLNTVDSSLVVAVVVVVIIDGPRNQPVKYGQNQVSNSWDIAVVVFVFIDAVIQDDDVVVVADVDPRKLPLVKIGSVR